MSLVEVMIAVAITSVVGAMIMTLMGSMGNMAQFFSVKEDYDGIYRATQLLLLNEQMCAFALRSDSGAPANPVGPVIASYNGSAQELGGIVMRNLTTGAEQVLYRKNGNFTNRLRVETITLQAGTDGGIVSFGGSIGQHRMWQTNLLVTAINLGGLDPANPAAPTTGGMKAIASKPIPITIVTTTANNFVGCYANTSNAALCAVLGAALDPATGRCAIPQCPPPGADPNTCPPPDSPPVPNGGCSPANYFVRYVQDAAPTCRCVQSCKGVDGAAGPAGPMGPAGMNSVSPPVYVY